MDITKIVIYLIGLLVTAITSILIPYLKSKISTEKYGHIAFWAQEAVEAAEKLYKESGMGAAKKEYVKSFLESKGFKLDMKELDIVIEAAVLEMQHAIAE